MLQDDIRSQWPIWKRLGDRLLGGSVSRTAAELVGATRLSELESRQQVGRRAAELQAAIYARAEEIGAPPPALDADIDALVYAAGRPQRPRPQESADPEGYYDWSVEWAARSTDASSLAFDAAAAVRRGAWDEALQEGLDADRMVETLQGLDRASDRPRLSELWDGPATPAAPEPGQTVDLDH